MRQTSTITCASCLYRFLPGGPGGGSGGPGGGSGGPGGGPGGPGGPGGGPGGPGASVSMWACACDMF